MTQRMAELAAEIVRLQGEPDREIENRRKILGWRIRNRFVEFEHGIAAEHRRLRTSVTSFLAQSPMMTIVTAPMIYSLIVPLLIVDAWASLYQAICFRAYRIPRVRRADYIAFDQKRLGYSNWIEALNCLYCSYANGESTEDPADAFLRRTASAGSRVPQHDGTGVAGLRAPVGNCGGLLAHPTDVEREVRVALAACHRLVAKLGLGA